MQQSKVKLEEKGTDDLSLRAKQVTYIYTHSHSHTHKHKEEATEYRGRCKYNDKVYITV